MPRGRRGRAWHGLDGSCRPAGRLAHPYRQGHGPYTGTVERDAVRIHGRSALSLTLTKAGHVSARSGADVRSELIKVLREMEKPVPVTWGAPKGAGRKAQRR